MLFAVPAGAHGARSGGPISGISIPGLSHGQMAVIAEYRGEILALAKRQAKTDPTFRRLLTFADVQYSYCLWGLVPGSLRDEESPFNECSHAYLSAAQALLVHMRDISDDKQPTEALISRIDADMVRNQASFVQCQFSGEAFNTAEVIFPIWRNVPSHTPSLIAFSTLAMAFAGGTILLAGGRRKDGDDQPC
ncbi:hypothetical protein [Mesorhizobium sp. A623]